MIKIVKSRYIVDRNLVYDIDEPSGHVSPTYEVGYYAIISDNLFFPFPGDLFTSIADFIFSYKYGSCYIERNPSYGIDINFSEIVEEFKNIDELYTKYPEYLI